MENPIPKWINKEFLSQCLQNELENPNILVENFNASPAVPPGENFLSSPFRVQIKYKTHQNDNELHFMSIIVKAERTEGQIMDVVDSLELSEPLFYSKFILEANKILKIPIVPKHISSPKLSVVVLEDLCEQGFRMANKGKGLDFEHCRLYVTAAAHLHAVSLADRTAPLLESIGKEKIFTNDSVMQSLGKNCIRNGFRCLIESVRKMDEFKKYSNLLKATSVVLWDLLLEAMKPSKVLNTINQGDPWTVNMMFKYNDKGNVIEIRLLDFQMIRYGSPINDLVWFLWSSASHHVRSNRLDELYHIYVETFNNDLNKFRCVEKITYGYVKDEIRRLSPLAIYLAAAFPPFNSEDAVTELDVFFKNENEDMEAQNIYKKYYNEHFCSHHLPKFLQQLEATEVFDYLEQCVNRDV